MAYDKDSNIGTFKAEQGRSSLDQFDLFKQQLSSIQLPINQNSSIQLPMNQNGSMQLPINQNSSIALQNSARQIDMLSMEEFGQNVSKLRKNLSITDAIQVNTDKEYGIMQIDNDLIFSGINGESITDSSQLYTSYTANVYRKSSCSKASELDAIGKISCKSVGMIVPCQIFSVEEDDIYGLQYLKTGSADPVVGELSISGADIELEETAESIIDSSNILIANGATEKWTSANSARGDYIVSISMSTRSIQDDWYVKSGIVFRPNQGSEQSSSGVFTTTNDVDSTASYATNGFDYFSFYLDIENRTGSPIKKSFIKSIVEVLDRTDEDEDVQQCSVYLLKNDSVVNDYECPECDIKIQLTNNKGTIQSYTFFIRKPSSGSSYGSVKLLDNIGSVFDWSYNTYFQGTEIATTKDTIECSMINSGASNTFLTNSPKELFGFVKSDSARFPITSFYTLISVNRTVSIGFVVRSNNSAQICTRYYLGENNIKYATSVNDIPIDISEFTISAINIIGSSDNHVDFVVVLNEISRYYSFCTSDMINGNKLISSSRNLLIMQSFDTNKSKDNQPVSIGTVTGVAGSTTCRIVGVDDNLYNDLTSNFKIDLCTKGIGTGVAGTSTQFIVSTINGLKDSVLSFTKAGTFVSSNLNIYLPCVYNYNAYMYYSGDTANINITESPLSYFKHIASVASIDIATNSFSSLPLRMEDEYPEIHSRSSVCDKAFIIGKTKFVSYKGTLYEGGSLRLCPDASKTYLYESDSTMYLCSQYVFTSKSNLTNIYAFSELGMQLFLTIEDEIICNPVKTSAGIVAIGRNGIWNVAENQARKIWQPSSSISKASLKTDLDNSCLAVLDLGGNVISQFTVEGQGLEIAGGIPIGLKAISFTIVGINQLGAVSSQDIDTDVQSVNFIDVGPTSDLVILDTVSGSTVRKLDIKANDVGDLYSIQSNQNVEMYQETICSDLVAMKMFYSGSGTIKLTINGVDIETKTLSQSGRYVETKFDLSIPMSMIDYKITCSKGIKLLQRIIGVVIPKEEFYG